MDLGLTPSLASAVGGGAALSIGGSFAPVTATSASGVNWAGLLDRIWSGVSSPQGMNTLGTSMQALALKQSQASQIPQIQQLPQSPQMPAGYQVPSSMIGWDQLAQAATLATAPANSIPYIIAMGGA